MKKKGNISLNVKIAAYVLLLILVSYSIMTVFSGNMLKKDMTDVVLQSAEELGTEMSSNVDLLIATSTDENLVSNLQAYCEKKASQDNL